jgi:hypothetical protein
MSNIGCVSQYLVEELILMLKSLVKMVNGEEHIVKESYIDLVKEIKNGKGFIETENYKVFINVANIISISDFED